MLSTKAIVSAVLIALPLAAAAGTRDPAVNQRQHNQQHRIQQGLKSGELTWDEANALRTQQRSIRQAERQYKSDGMLTRDERKDLYQDLNAASRSIHGEKHDAETRN